MMDCCTKCKWKLNSDDEVDVVGVHHANGASRESKRGDNRYGIDDA
jgi:hypothetical protein